LYKVQYTSEQRARYILNLPRQSLCPALASKPRHQFDYQVELGLARALHSLNLTRTPETIATYGTYSQRLVHNHWREIGLWEERWSSEALDVSGQPSKLRPAEMDLWDLPHMASRPAQLFGDQTDDEHEVLLAGTSGSASIQRVTRALASATVRSMWMMQNIWSPSWQITDEIPGLWPHEEYAMMHPNIQVVFPLPSSNRTVQAVKPVLVSRAVDVELPAPSKQQRQHPLRTHTEEPILYAQGDSKPPPIPCRASHLRNEKNGNVTRSVSSLNSSDSKSPNAINEPSHRPPSNPPVLATAPACHLQPPPVEPCQQKLEQPRPSRQQVLRPQANEFFSRSKSTTTSVVSAPDRYVSFVAKDAKKNY
jgi:hypothetical protein